MARNYYFVKIWFSCIYQYLMIWRMVIGNHSCFQWNVLIFLITMTCQILPLYIITNIDNWYIPGNTYFLYHIYKALKRRPLMTYKEKKWCYLYRATFLFIVVLTDLISLYGKHCINIAPRVLRNTIGFWRKRSYRPLT